ncbi:unnamed protein product [Aphanomyces euteiches]
MAKCERPPESDEAPAAWTRTSFSTYDQAAEASSLDVGSIIHYNIICLIHGNNDGLVVHGERASYENAFRPRPLITERMFVNSYETVRNSLYNSNSLNLEKLLKYSTVWKPSELLNRLVLSYVAEQEAKGRPGVSILEGTEFEKHFKNVVDELVAQQIVIAKQKIAELEGTPASTLELRNKRSPSLREPPRLPSNCPARLKSGFGLGVEVSLRGYSLAR